MEFNWMELLYKIFEVALIPLLGVLVAYCVQFLRAKSAELGAKTDNEVLAKYIGMLTNTVTDCVIATNQTYVEALKKLGSFDVAAQKSAFELTRQAVLNVLSEDAKNYLTNIYGDLNTYIDNLIEAEVNRNNNKKASR